MKKKGLKAQSTEIKKPLNLVGILLGPIAFERSRNNITFLTSISSVGLRKKEFILTGGRKLWKLFLEYLIDDWVSRSSHPEVFSKKGVVRNLTKFTGKHLW